MKGRLAKLEIEDDSVYLMEKWKYLLYSLYEFVYNYFIFLRDAAWFSEKQCIFKSRDLDSNSSSTKSSGSLRKHLSSMN